MLWEHHGAPKLDGHVSKFTKPSPRNVTVTEKERAAILAAASPGQRLWILLCSDLALRSGTASRINSGNYSPTKRELRFATKKGAKQTLPVTAELAELIETCDLASDVAFVRQLLIRYPPSKGRGRTQPKSVDNSHLRLAWRTITKNVGITRRIIPHDLRRTTAVGMLEATHDIRQVQSLLGHRTLQSTIWYLDHDLFPVSPATLELIKGNRKPAPPQEKTA